MAYRVLIAQFMHETNTFSVLPTTLDDYRRRWLVQGQELAARDGAAADAGADGGGGGGGGGGAGGQAGQRWGHAGRQAQEVRGRGGFRGSGSK